MCFIIQIRVLISEILRQICIDYNNGFQFEENQCVSLLQSQAYFLESIQSFFLAVFCHCILPLIYFHPGTVNACDTCSNHTTGHRLVY